MLFQSEEIKKHIDLVDIFRKKQSWASQNKQ